MSELITRTNGQPFKSEGAAKAKLTTLLKGGVKTEVINHGDGFALKPVGTHTPTLSESFGGLPINEEPQETPPATPQETPTPPKRRRPPRRTKITSRSVLTAPHRPGFVRRFVNDTPGNIKRRLDQGYEIVQDDVQIGDTGSLTDKGMGSVPQKVVDKTTAMKAVLMEIPEDWYNEDQAEKAKVLKEREDQIKRQPQQEGQYGKVELGPNTY
jgi:hypothetical protein